MKFYSLKTNARPLNKVRSLPVIKSYKSKNNSDFNTSNISATTNASMIKGNRNNDSIIQNVSKNKKILKKIKANNLNRCISSSSIFSTKTDISKKTIDILENADQIMRERLKNHGAIIAGGKNLFRSVALKISKEVGYKNYTINLLKEKRTQINEKEFLISSALKEFDEQYQMDHRKFNDFIEEVKRKQKKEEDTITKLKEIREKKENIYEQEKLLNKRLDETLERKVRDFYTIKSYGSFVHKILEKPFIYDQTPEINSRLRNHEQIANLIINLYESKDKYNSLPKELEDNEIMEKKYTLFEDKIIRILSIKERFDKELENVIKNYENELAQLEISKSNYESNLNYVKNEKNNVNIEMKNFRIHEDENLENYLNYIIELGKEIKTNCPIPILRDKSYLNEFVLYSKKTLLALEKKEEMINSNILEILTILKHGNSEDKELMESLIMKQKNLNKKENQIRIKKKQEELKNIKDKKTIEKANKLVVKGRKVILDYPIIKNRHKSEKIVKKDNDDDIDIQYSYSDDEDKY